MPPQELPNPECSQTLCCWYEYLPYPKRWFLLTCRERSPSHEKLHLSYFIYSEVVLANEATSRAYKAHYAHSKKLAITVSYNNLLKFLVF